MSSPEIQTVKLFSFSMLMLACVQGLVINTVYRRKAVFSSLGAEGWKTLTMGHRFLNTFGNSRENNGQAFSGTFAPRLITPVRKACRCDWVWARAWLQLHQNSGNWMFKLRVKTLSARDSHWRNPRRRTLYRVQQCKNTPVCALIGSVMFSTHWETNTCRPTHSN